MMSYTSKRFHNFSSASLWFLALLFGVSIHCGHSYNRKIEKHSGGIRKIQVPPIPFRSNPAGKLGKFTDEISNLLQVRRDLLSSENVTDVDDFDGSEIDLEGVTTPANGCTICLGLPFLPNKVPNQNILQEPPLTNLTCQQWQDDVLPLFVPNGEDCPSYYFYQEFFVSCCSPNIPRYQCEENVHKLHASNENYNAAVPPIVSNEKPLEVGTDIVFEYLETVDVMTGAAKILVSIILKWNDPRLAWTVDHESTCANFINTWTGYDIETTSIWVPDFDLYNIIQGFQELPGAMATVTYDGSVEWRRSGSITGMCSYTGLGSIPFDTLGCQFLFGARSRGNANMLHFKFLEENITVGRSDLKYSEFRPVPELFEKGYTWYFNQDYAAAMYYNFYFKRATNFYLMNVVVPAIILTYASFGTFLLDMRVGERLGFAMALALVIIAAQIVTFDLVPVSNEKLWIDKFITWSFYWVLFVLVQSVFIAYVSVVREDVLVMTKENPSNPSTEGTEDRTNAVNTADGNATKADENRRGETDVWSDEVDNKKSASMHHSEDLGKQAENEILQFEGISYAPELYIDICLAVSVVSYTIFVISMFVTNFNGAWTRDDPSWDDESSSYGTDQYSNNNPKA